MWEAVVWGTTQKRCWHYRVNCHPKTRRTKAGYMNRVLSGIYSHMEMWKGGQNLDEFADIIYRWLPE